MQKMICPLHVSMNNATSSYRLKNLIAGLIFPFFSFSALSATLDFGVDPEHLGTGEWVYVMKDCVKQLGGAAENVNDAPSMFKFFKKHDIDFIAVKAGTGAKDFPTAEAPQFTPELVKQAHEAGLRIFGYTRSDGKDVTGEIALACKVNAMGADGFIIDAEAEWEASRLDDRGPRLAIQLCQGIRAAYPTRFLGHAPMPIISKHSSFPYKEFGRYCDATMPQAYWKSIGVSPKRMVEWMENEWHAFNNSLSGDWKQAIKPLAPIAQAWSPTADRILRGAEILQFANELKAVKNPASPTGYKGISYWRCDLHSKGMWKAIRRVNILKNHPTDLDDDEKADLLALEKINPAASQSATDVIIDNNSDNATFEGKWFPGKMKPNRFGSNYECIATVAGEPTGKATFRPKITKAGNYDVYVWYPNELEKSGKVTYTIAHQGTTEQVTIDQTTNGGQWVLIASEKFFDAGTEGYLSFQNNLGNNKSIIVADAVRFRLSVLPDQAAPSKESIEAAQNGAPTPATVDAPVPAPAPAVAPVPPPAPPAPTPTPAPVVTAKPAVEPEVKKPAPAVTANPGIVVAKAEIIIKATDPQVTYTGNWHVGRMGSGYFTTDYRWASTTEGEANATAVFTPDIPVAGGYNVYTWHTVSTNRSKNARWEISSADGFESGRVNQRQHGGRWILLAKNKQFAAGKSGYIKLTNNTGERGAGDNIIIADAVRLVLKSQDKEEPIEAPTEKTPVKAPNKAASETAAKFAESERDILLDNLNPEVTFEGKWNPESLVGCFGADSLLARTSTGNATASAVFRPTINVAGEYDVYVWYPQNPNNSTNAQWLVSWEGGNAMISVDQTRDGGKWVLLASAKPFARGNGGTVTLFNDTSDAIHQRRVVADAVRFRLRSSSGNVSTSR